MAGLFANQTVLAVDFTDVIGGSPTYADIAALVSLDWSFMADALDTTVHGDTNRTRVPGIRDAGPLNATLRFLPESHAALIDAAIDGTVCAWKITIPKEDATNTTAQQFEFNGFITNLGLAAPHDGLLEATVTITTSGAAEITDEA